MTTPRLLAAEAMAPHLTALEDLEDGIDAHGAALAAAGAWLYVGEIDRWHLFALTKSGDGDAPDWSPPSPEDEPSAAGRPDPDNAVPPRGPGSGTAPTSEARDGRTTVDAGGCQPAPGPDSTPAGGADPAPVPPAGSIEDHGLAAWIADLPVNELRSANDFTTTLLEIRKRARAVLEAPAPEPVERRRRELIEKIYRKLLPRHARAVLQGQLRRRRANGLAELDIDELETVIKAVTIVARRQGWEQ